MFERPSREEVNRLREKYPEGTIIRVDNMEDERGVPAGTLGEVSAVDDYGQIHCKNFGLAVIPNIDTFHIVQRWEVVEQTTNDGTILCVLKDTLDVGFPLVYEEKTNPKYMWIYDLCKYMNENIGAEIE